METTITERIHPFKRRCIGRIADDPVLREHCAELWVFGSSVEGASERKHTVFSDIDLGILPKENQGFRIDTPQCRRIHECIMDDLTENGRITDFDIVWLNRHPSDALLANVRKGIRLI